MAIVDARGFNLVPDIAPAVQGIGNLIQQGRQRRAESDAEEDRRQASIVGAFRAIQDPSQRMAYASQVLGQETDPQFVRGFTNLAKQPFELQNQIADQQLKAKGFDQFIPAPIAPEKGVIIKPGEALVGQTTGKEIALGPKELEDTLKTTNNKFTQAKALREEIRKADPDFIKIEDAIGRVNASAQDPSAAGDLALIFNFMKVLDPGSTVREGEFATAQNAAGVDQRVRSTYRRVLRGERLTPEQRADFTGRADKLFQSQKKLRDKRVKTILDVGEKFDISEDFILGNEQQQQEPTQLRGVFNGLPETEKVKFLQQATPEELKQLGLL